VSGHAPALPFHVSEFAPSDIERRLEFVDLGPGDRKRIAAVRAAVLDHLDDHLAAFFDHLRKFEEARTLLSDSELADEVRRLKREHLVAMVSGDYGRQYVNQRFRLGQIYSQARLEVSVFMGAFHSLMASIGRQIMRDFPGDGLGGFAHFSSLKRVAFFDIAIIVDAMMDDREETILRQQEAISANAAAAAAHEVLKAEVAEREAHSQELVEASRLASLGGLVAGIAHELNTPIGNALMVSSSFRDAVRDIQTELESGALRRSSIDGFLRTSEEASRLLDLNLLRASEQIHSFKQLAVDQTGRRRRSFNLAHTIGDAVRSCTPKVRKANVRIDTDIDAAIEMEGYPGLLSQVLINLIENAVKHGLADTANGEVRIVARQAADSLVRIVVGDNGVGIPEALSGKVFGAFFTTQAEDGGTGLGLHIVKTIVTGPLGGTISLKDGDKTGAQFVITMPCSAPDQARAPSQSLAEPLAVS
jgi:signal transduction histidine kinase